MRSCHQEMASLCAASRISLSRSKLTRKIDWARRRPERRSSPGGSCVTRGAPSGPAARQQWRPVSSELRSGRQTNRKFYAPVSLLPKNVVYREPPIRDAPNLPRSLAVSLTAPATQQDQGRGQAMAEQAFCFVLGGILPLAGILWLFCH